MKTQKVWKEFSENVITHSGAHHLLAVLELTKERGYARVTDIARSLKITSGSASVNLKKLKARGLVVEDENRFLALSDDGAELAKAIIDRRKILIGYFTKVLGVDSKQAAIDACKTEHLLSAETTQKMSEQLELG